MAYTEAGNTILNIKKCLLHLSGISLIPPPGCCIAPIYFTFLICFSLPMDYLSSYQNPPSSISSLTISRVT